MMMKQQQGQMEMMLKQIQAQMESEMRMKSELVSSNITNFYYVFLDRTMSIF